MKLFLHPDLYLKKSPVHGYGVFTNGFICKNTILEECRYFDVCSANEPNNVLIQYRYSFPQHNPVKYVILTGFGSIYNHSETPNATWYIDFERDLFVFKTTQNVFANQELFTYYGGNSYWEGVNISINK
jgi:SET domain-containing protein